MRNRFIGTNSEYGFDQSANERILNRWIKLQEITKFNYEVN